MKVRVRSVLILVSLFLVIGVSISLFLVAGSNPPSAAPDVSDIKVLPKANTTGGMPLMEALALRVSGRSFSERALPDQVLSDLLWACWGVTRPDGRRTAPTSRNKQNIQVYAALESGVWLYEGVKHELVRVLKDDVRAKFGGAPLTLIYAAEDGYYASGMHAGSLYQNVGLYCASVGLANVVKLNGVDVLDAAALKLPEGYRVYIVQPVGYPRS